MSHETSAYGLWSLVVINSGIFIVFAFSFYHPKTRRDWRSFGAFSAFVIALFTEMYGFPLTIYLLSGWLTSRYPGINWYEHQSGHLWHSIFGLKGDAHFDIFHLLSSASIVGGFVLLSNAWRVLYNAQRNGDLATAGMYAHIRHPQYAGFILIMVGFLLQWPTLITVVMFPILVCVYASLARREENEILLTFGKAYVQYAAVTPRFIPALRSHTQNLSNRIQEPTKGELQWKSFH